VHGRLETAGHKRRVPEEKISDLPPGNMDTLTMKRFSIDKAGTMNKRRSSMKVRWYPLL
jgi:hypothetical protein